MGCGDAHDLISAAADGELTAELVAALDAHLLDCEGCRRYVGRVAGLSQQIERRRVITNPAVIGAVLDRAQTARLGRGRWVRPALVWCAVMIAFESFRPLFVGEIDGVHTHVARHLGASALAFAIGLAYAAWKPAKAAGLVPVAAVLLATSIGGAVIDTATGMQAPLAESVHLLDLVGFVLLWMVAGSPGWERVRGGVGVFRSTGVARPTM